jgi:hypothetical protein
MPRSEYYFIGYVHSSNILDEAYCQQDLDLPEMKHELDVQPSGQTVGCQTPQKKPSRFDNGFKESSLESLDSFGPEQIPISIGSGSTICIVKNAEKTDVTLFRERHLTPNIGSQA